MVTFSDLVHKSKQLLLAFSGLAILSGCAMTGSTSFQSMSSAYREVLEGYANDNILINIVRASEQLPMTFLDMPSVIGTGSIGANASVNAIIQSANPSSFAGFFSATDLSNVNPYVGLAVNNSFNFTQSSLDNASFMTEFLSDLTPEDINSLTNNNAGPKSILYSLVIENIEIRDSTGKTIRQWENDPASPDYKEFQQMLYRLIDSGLRTELVNQKEILSGPMTLAEVNRNLMAIMPAFSQPNVALIPTDNKKGAQKYELVRMTPVTRMCLMKTQREEKTLVQFSDAAFCNPHYANSDIPHNMIGDLSAPGITQDGKHVLAIKLRSPRNVFSFLGTIVFLQLKPDPVVITIKDSDQFAKRPELITNIDDDSTSIPLFKVVKNDYTVDAIASINYRGNTYSIPGAKTSTSREVLVLLSEILTLSKVPGAIPPSPAVLIN